MRAIFNYLRDCRAAGNVIGVDAGLRPEHFLIAMLSLAFGVVVGVVHGFWPGFLLYLCTSLSACVSLDVHEAVCLPTDARQAAIRTLHWFRQQFPHEKVGGVAVRAVEPGRFVILIESGCGDPLPRRYFAVPADGSLHITELRAEDWRPAGLK